LHGRGSATPHELDEATAALRRAEANAAAATARARASRAGLDRARASADAAATTRSFTTITAPFAGVVVEKLVEAGNMAAPGTPLLRIEDPRAFRLEVTVDESRAPQIAPGQNVDVQLDPGPPGSTAAVKGTVDEVARAVSADTRAFLVKIALPPVEGLRSGRYGHARFHGASKQALTLPEGALVRQGQLTSVFVVDGDRARLRLVNVSGREVLAGLSPGEVVVVNPPPDLVDGRRVTTGGVR
jgi:RND family efflux transporter MFP subunit